MPLPKQEFAGEPEPYTTVEVKLQIRILQNEVTRSRVSVNIYPEPVLEPLATSQLSRDEYGKNDAGEFVVNLSDNFNAWADLNCEYPRFDSRLQNPVRSADVEAMNQYVDKSVKWVMKLHGKAMRLARRHQQS